MQMHVYVLKVYKLRNALQLISHMSRSPPYWNATYAQLSSVFVTRALTALRFRWFVRGMVQGFYVWCGRGSCFFALRPLENTSRRWASQVFHESWLHQHVTYVVFYKDMLPPYSSNSTARGHTKEPLLDSFMILLRWAIRAIFGSNDFSRQYCYFTIQCPNFRNAPKPSHFNQFKGS